MEDSYSKYFTFKELTDSKGHPEMVSANRLDAKQFQNAGKRLSKLLESIRHILGDKPITVTSGYRNARLNKAVGSVAKNSAHLRFEAADIKPEMNLKEAFNALIMAHKGGLLPDLRKVLIESSWLHVQVKMNVDEPTEFYTTNDNVNFTKVG
jgi:hypothetical protein